ncbi:MAG: alpha/beta hydrolase family protein [Pseudooceanicola atlanticus]
MLKSISTFLLACGLAAPGIAESPIGVQALTAGGGGDDPHHLSLSVWYPAQDGGTPEDVGGNAVFVGHPAHRDAAMAPGHYPLVLLSHGGLRSAADSGAWLSGRLAHKGFIVAEVNAPRPDSAADAVNEIWRRPQAVSGALDRILTDPAWSSAVDPSRIAVAGYALGGTSALALAGGAINRDAFATTCAADANGPDCAWYAAQGVSLSSVDAEALERTHRDPRIGTAIAIDPEYAETFVAQSLIAPQADIVVIGLGARDDSLVPAADLPRVVIETATRFDAFPVCTEKGEFILAEDGGDATLCAAGKAERARIHDEIAGRIGAILNR